MMLGPPATQTITWLCWECFLMTPNGVSFTQDRVREALGDTDDLHTDEAVAGNKQATD